MDELEDRCEFRMTRQTILDPILDGLDVMIRS